MRTSRPFSVISPVAAMWPKRRSAASPGVRSSLRDHQEGAPDRLWPRLFAARVIGADCPPAEGLPGDMRRRLEELAAQGDAAVAPPQASPPDPVE